MSNDYGLMSASCFEWLGRWFGPHRDAIVATRPWVTPGSTTSEGRPVRYSAAGDAVYAFVRSATGSITLTDVRATTTTSVGTVDGTPVPWRDAPTGLTIDLPVRSPGPEPVVLALDRVEARASAPSGAPAR
jgi:hypothetical protein